MSGVQYGPWNPRGTTNSEYGRFVYQNNFIGTEPPGRNFNGQNWVPDLSNFHQEHLPTCHNYVQGQDQGQGAAQQGQYQYQHQPGCHNYQPQPQAQGQGQSQQDDRPVDVFVGEDAATAALGGKEQFQMHFPEYVKNVQFQQPQPQSGAVQSQPQPGSDRASNEICGQMSQMSLKPADVNPSNIQMPMASPSPSPVPEHCEPEMASPTTPTTATAIQGQAECPTGNGDGGQKGPTMENSCKLPTKWRGLPQNIQYGRHVRPLYARQMQMHMQNPQQQQQPNCLTDAQLQQEIGMMVPGQPDGCGEGDASNSMPIPMSKSKPVKRVPLPAKAKYLNKVSSSATSMPVTTTGGKTTNSLKKTSASCSGVTALCGKCPKCKDYLPPVTGPVVMSFPKSTTATLPKPNLHKMLNNGGQDAKNFRAIQFNRKTNAGKL